MEKKQKFAVIIEQKIHIPGDERSRTNPGHGYPASWKEYTEIKEFDSQEKLVEWIKNNENKKIRVIRFEELEIKKDVSILITAKKEK